MDEVLITVDEAERDPSRTLRSAEVCWPAGFVASHVEPGPSAWHLSLVPPVTV
ncbi:hypothetical protein SANBI_002330 [Sanguibacter sp. 4.1]|uniref:Uncharacterized protein n=1 Tax=Sanguibacter biliveldensis TaxID=3030830 RepID=A0AAF0Z669_9MICO|nr:hypothetical protein [Sanguibacter sp. 4.1]WPF81066.1 hypothetical protein SANBI_002330 [Sanguibacter sp. 4.1]